MMGDRTPNIDRLAKEEMMFTDSYGGALEDARFLSKKTSFTFAYNFRGIPHEQGRELAAEMAQK